jgi:hypothetical protein
VLVIFLACVIVVFVGMLFVLGAVPKVKR